MSLTKTTFVGQSANDPSCYGCVAAMAVGKSLEEFKTFTGRNSSVDGKAYTLKEVSTWLLEHNMGFVPLGYLYNYVEKEEVPGVELKVKIDADTMEILEGYAEQLGMDLGGVVNGILTRALVKYGARSREGYRYVRPGGYEGSNFKAVGHLKYVIPMSGPAIVCVTRPGAGPDHALFWDGSLLWDPAVPEDQNPVDVDSYTVIAWQPVGTFKDSHMQDIYQGFLSRAGGNQDEPA